jgi:type IV secretion system protein VirB3
MAGTGRLQADPLFQGLSRPAMMFGVSFMYFVLNGGINLLIFIQTSNFVMLLFCLPVIHAIGYFLCSKEARAVELFVLKCSKGMKCLNRRFHGYTNSYDVF